MTKSRSFWEHPIETLEEALHIRKQIAALEEKLDSIFIITPPSLAALPVKRGRKGMSAAGRARIAAAQRARWAKVKGTSPAPAPKPAKKKGGISAEGRARIAAAQRARWAARK